MHFTSKDCSYTLCKDSCGLLLYFTVFKRDSSSWILEGFVSVACVSFIKVMVTLSRISSAVLRSATASNSILMTKASSRCNTQKRRIRFECLRWIMERNQGEHFCPSVYILIGHFRSISLHKDIWLITLTAMKC